jgi:uncharacterized membrane-anchored protein
MVIFAIALAATFAALIALVTVAHLGFRMNAVLAFWAAYVLTRPLGASIGDLMSQTRRTVASASERRPQASSSCSGSSSWSPS